MEPKRIDQIFWEAADLATPGERDAYLDRTCAGDAELRGKVQLLLDAQSKVESFLETPAVRRRGGNLAAPFPDDDTRTEPGGGTADESLNFLTPSDKPGVLGRLDHYEVQELIGQGGMGVVLRAFDEKLHRVVAVKVMAKQLATNANARKRFAREARAAAAVRNEHVVDIHAVQDAGPLPYLVMEYIAGPSLQDRLDRDGPLQVAEVLRIGMQAAAGLAAAHAQGLIHRDVKPSNIMLENGVERVKLTDFGLARAVDDASLTQSGVVAGTPQYMSPEQAHGEAVDHRADLFSLGSVLYAMCTGRPPFRASGTMAVLKRVCEEEPRPIRETNTETPDWLAAIIARLQAKNPAERFQSATEVAELLGQHLAHLQRPAAVPTPVAVKPTVPPPTRRHRRTVAVAALLCLVGGLVLTDAVGMTNIRATVSRIFTSEEAPVAQLKREADPPTDGKAESQDFVILNGGGEVSKFTTLAEAVQGASNGDTIEIRGNGPFVSAPISISRTALTIRAGAGFRPIIRLRPEDGRAPALLVTSAPLVLEGLELQRMSEEPPTHDPFRVIVFSMKAPLHIANCQFLCKKVHNCISTLSPVCELRNCLFICDVYAHTVISDLEIGRRIVIDNCLQAGGEFTLSYGSLPLDDVWAATLIKVTRTTCLPKTRALAFHLVGREGKDEGRRVKVLGVEASRNVFDAESILAFAQLQPGKLLPVHDAEALLTQLVNWQGRGNLFALNGHLLVLGTREKQLDPAKPIKSIGDWKEFWRSAEAESIEGRVRYVGGDLRSKLRDAPEKLTPNDFRLRPDSAGYRAGKDGKDLGADVDLVGPGPAYERWQKTLAYQKWLKDSGQMKE